MRNGDLLASVIQYEWNCIETVYNKIVINHELYFLSVVSYRISSHRRVRYRNQACCKLFKIRDRSQLNISTDHIRSSLGTTISHERDELKRISVCRSNPSANIVFHWRSSSQVHADTSWLARYKYACWATRSGEIISRWYINTFTEAMLSGLSFFSWFSGVTGSDPSRISDTNRRVNRRKEK